MAPSSQELEPPANPGRFTRAGGEAVALAVASKSGELGKVIAEVRAATGEAAKAATAAKDAAWWSGRSLPKPWAAGALVALLIAFVGAFAAGWHFGHDGGREAAIGEVAVERAKAQADLEVARLERQQVPQNQAWLARINDRAAAEWSQTPDGLLARRLLQNNGFSALNPPVCMRNTFSSDPTTRRGTCQILVWSNWNQ